MVKFICGIVFAAGMAVFGKSMYELGRSRGEQDSVEKTKIVLTTAKEMAEIFTKKEEES